MYRVLYKEVLYVGRASTLNPGRHLACLEMTRFLSLDPSPIPGDTASLKQYSQHLIFGCLKEGMELFTITNTPPIYRTIHPRAHGTSIGKSGG